MSRGAEALERLLSPPADYDEGWRRFDVEAVQLRVRLLREDELVFGLVPDEVAEVERLEAYLAGLAP